MYCIQFKFQLNIGFWVQICQQVQYILHVPTYSSGVAVQGPIVQLSIYRLQCIRLTQSSIPACSLQDSLQVPCPFLALAWPFTRPQAARIGVIRLW